MKKYNYKYLIGFIIGILLSGGSVYAGIMYSSNIISYNHASSTLTSNNVQAAIDELAAKTSNVTSCPSGKLCLAKKSTLALGDYVIYTPNKTSYTTDTAYTGYTSTQTINPSELTLWRVISLNQDGTVDIISEYVSSVEIYFNGLTGYKNFVGYLNVLASQYENSTYTTGSRYLGYDDQTEYITNTTYFKYPASWSCSTGGTCNPDPDDYESFGGGDIGYITDYDLLENVLNTRIAKKVGTSRNVSYWMASRHYIYYGSDNYHWDGRYVTSEGYNTYTSSLYEYAGSNNFREKYSQKYLRPIVTLKSNLTYTGVGNEDFPMEIVLN